MLDHMTPILLLVKNINVKIRYFVAQGGLSAIAVAAAHPQTTSSIHEAIFPSTTLPAVRNNDRPELYSR